MTRRGKIFLFYSLASCVLVICLFFIFYHPAKLLEVDFLDVGQGDAELIKTPYGQKILIDGGPDNKVMSELGRNLPLLNRQIDLVILTHPHDDHVIGLIDVLKKYQVKKILLTAAVCNAPAYEELLNLVQKKNISVQLVAGQEQITLGEGMELDILYPDKNDLGADLNEDSIVARLVYRKKGFLFTGDAGILTEERLMSRNIQISSDVLKVGHHGSETASSLDFLKAVSSSVAIIELGANNKFGFPKADTIWRLQKAGNTILRTDEKGTIRIKSDGENLRFKK